MGTASVVRVPFSSCWVWCMEDAGAAVLSCCLDELAMSLCGVSIGLSAKEGVTFKGISATDLPVAGSCTCCCTFSSTADAAGPDASDAAALLAFCSVPGNS